MMAYKFDFERAALLFGIMKSVADIGPMWTAISSEAGAELKEMNDKLVEEQKRRKTGDVIGGQPVSNPVPSKPVNRIFPEGSGVQEEHDTPVVQRKV